MSFILDALKKSENERQRHRGPSLVDVPARRAVSNRPWWFVALAGLLVLNLIVFLVVMLRDEDPPVAAPQAAQAPAPAPAVQPAPMPAARATPISRPQPDSDPTVRSLAEEAGVMEEGDMEGAVEPPPMAEAAEVPPGPRIVSPIEGPTATPARAPPSAPTRPSDENLPSFNDITASGSAQFPPLHLDIHVFATAPADRFVFINMKKYREGESMSEGPTVERIRRDDVVLNHRGLRFVLPRQ